MWEFITPFVAFGIGLALLFDFLNGMNDAANSIATVISTRVLSPAAGVFWAAFFNMLGAFAFGVSVATTVGKGIVDPNVVTPTLVCTALMSAIFWTHLCTRYGLPISVSHSLIGGLCGAAIVKTAGVSSLVGYGLLKIAVFIVLSPIIGLVISAMLIFALTLFVQSFSRRGIDRVASKLQILSSAAYAIAHGTNDAQKTMGIIAVLLFSAGALGKEFFVPWQAIIACTVAMGLGTLLGGWKVICTMGMKLTNLRPLSGFAAETGGAIAVIGCSIAGIPVSTTHTIAGSIVGVGLVRRVGAVRWGMATHVVWAWIFTLPVTAIGGALAYYLLLLLGCK